MRTKEEIEKLVEDNIRLVDFVLYKYFKLFINLYPNLVDDIKQEGYIGLIKAAERFDESKGAFTTVATLYIKGTMNKFYQKYVKKHYNNPNIKVISGNDTITDDEKVTLFEVIPLEEHEKDYRIDAIITRAEYSEIKDINLIMKMTLQGYTQEEIANVIGTQQSHVSRRISKIRQEYMAISKLCELTHNIKIS